MGINRMESNLHFIIVLLLPATAAVAVATVSSCFIDKPPSVAVSCIEIFFAQAIRYIFLLLFLHFLLPHPGKIKLHPELSHLSNSFAMPGKFFHFAAPSHSNNEQVT